MPYAITATSSGKGQGQRQIQAWPIRGNQRGYACAAAAPAVRGRAADGAGPLPITLPSRHPPASPSSDGPAKERVTIGRGVDGADGQQRIEQHSRCTALQLLRRRKVPRGKGVGGWCFGGRCGKDGHDGSNRGQPSPTESAADYCVVHCALAGCRGQCKGLGGAGETGAGWSGPRLVGVRINGAPRNQSWRYSYEYCSYCGVSYDCMYTFARHHHERPNVQYTSHTSSLITSPRAIEGLMSTSRSCWPGCWRFQETRTRKPKPVQRLFFFHSFGGLLTKELEF